ncbi:hypothetical protein GH714_005320 [Hevea brasiliensis]|uniref:EF-hand domain-containing protein n=2 Tax=Hevea brasiliensis TaxID=3981 RepID=A0A6A6MBN7_HEVBR|nr:hypothetical protein GH714_005320 [Hevea brasiliensis]
MPLSVPKSVSGSYTEGQLMAFFKEQDVNGDGRLSKEEIKKAFQQLGSRLPGWRVRRALHHADVNGDGSISLDELDELVKYVESEPHSAVAKMPLSVPKSVSGTYTEGQLKAIFKEHDANGDGRLSKEEMKKAFQQLGSRLPGWRVRRALHHADANGDGSISVDELDELVKYVGQFGYSIQ